MSTTIISAQQHAADIDALLEQYLHLLDTYTSLRAELSATLSSINQNIARANFSAPRGVRYGEELYDQRMRASCTCHFSPSPSSLSGITLSISSSSTETESAETTKHPYDPLRMFGILLPTPLRSAAAESSGLVRDLVPRIIETDMQMREMEIRIRRGRKGLRKAGGGAG